MATPPEPLLGAVAGARGRSVPRSSEQPTRIQPRPGVALEAKPHGATVEPAAAPRTGSARGHWLDESVPAATGLVDDDFSFIHDMERYEIVSFLGAGGMGRVFKARDVNLGRFVALKFLRFNDPRQLERFLREARSQARVEHENICKVYEASWVESHPYIAMQLIEGVTLAEGAELLSLEQKVKVIRDVALAIHAAHRMGLIHRDLKPGNILLERRHDGGWHPWVVDFGLAQDQESDGLTRTGAVTGTPAYLSPEQARAEPVDRRSDVYSLGAVLYELLAGQVPLKGSSLAESLIKVVQEPPVPLARRNSSIPRDLDTIVLKCLEKEPQRRYDSARALAEDLDRYLDDEPIAARPPSFSYRAGKWIRKNRALAAVMAGALALALIGTAIFLRALWLQAERAELMQRFSEEVTRAEGEMRLASYLPFQDITPYKDDVEATMDAIRREMDSLGEVADGPGHYALGRGYLALHRYELALEHLEKAWEAGYQRPEVAEGLGRALGVLYQRALLVASSDTLGEDEAASSASEEGLDQSLRLPALAYLRLSEEAKGPYTQAMIAFYDRRYPEALELAAAAGRDEPWFYEARQLTGEIYMEMGDQARGRGDHAAAFDHYDQAAAAYRDVLDIARSDATVYAAECGRAVRVMSLRAEKERLPDASFEEAGLACRQAAEVDRELAEPYTYQSSLYWLWGREMADSDDDPTEKYRQAARHARRALELNPREVLALGNLSLAQLDMARWEKKKGRPADDLLARSIESAHRALAIQPDHAELHNQLASAYVIKASWEKLAGVDPRPNLEQAISALRECTRLAPRLAQPWNNIGYARLIQAEYEIDRGLDPSASIEASVEALEKALELNPNHPLYRNLLGTAALTLGEYQLGAEADPTDALKLAMRTFRASLAEDPTYDLAYGNIAWSYRYLAAYKLRIGADPRAELQAARDALGSAMDLKPKDPENFLELARIEHLAARWAMAAVRDPRPRFRAARQAVVRGLEVNDQHSDLYLESALLAWRWAEWRAGDGAAGAEGDGAEHLRWGLEAARKARELSPEAPEPMAVEGVLLARQAEAGPRGPEREAQRREARRLLTTALEENPKLSREYGDVLRGLGGSVPARPAAEPAQPRGGGEAVGSPPARGRETAVEEGVRLGPPGEAGAEKGIKGAASG